MLLEQELFAVPTEEIPSSTTDIFNNLECTSETSEPVVCALIISQRMTYQMDTGHRSSCFSC